MSGFAPLTPEQLAAEQKEMEVALAEFERQLAQQPEALAWLDRLVADLGAKMCQKN